MAALRVPAAGNFIDAVDSLSHALKIRSPDIEHGCRLEGILSN